MNRIVFGLVQLMNSSIPGKDIYEKISGLSQLVHTRIRKLQLKPRPFTNIMVDKGVIAFSGDFKSKEDRINIFNSISSTFTPTKH